MATQYDLSEFALPQQAAAPVAQSYDLSEFAVAPQQTSRSKKSSYLKDMIDSDMFQSLMGQVKQIPQGAEQELFGAGDAMRNSLAKMMNVLPGVNIGMAQTGPQGPAYNVGQAAGEMLPYAIGGEVLAPVTAAAEAVPYVGKALSSLGGAGMSGLTGRAAAAGSYGASQNPDDRLTGALEGAGLSAGFEGAGKAVSKIMPKQYMSQVFDSVKDLLTKEKSASKEAYGEIMRPFGNQPINLKGIDEDVFKTTTGLKKIYSDFQEEPSIKNAHRLQSQLGAADRKLKGVDVASSDRKNAYQENRDLIQIQINKALGSKYPEAANKYVQASQHYKEKVIPLDMTHKALNKIVQPTPEKVIRKIEEVTKRSEYPTRAIGGEQAPIIPNDIAELQKGLSEKVRNRNVAQGLAGGSLSAGLAHALGLSPIADVGAALVGTGLPSLLHKVPGIGKKSSSKNLYGPVYKALIAKLLGGQ
jgi:hypothetical protein